MSESREEFEKRYVKEFPRTVFGVTDLSLPCTCEEGGGSTHWAAVLNNPEAIEWHESLERVLADNRQTEQKGS